MIILFIKGNEKKCFRNSKKAIFLKITSKTGIRKLGLTSLNTLRC